MQTGQSLEIKSRAALLSLTFIHSHAPVNERVEQYRQTDREDVERG